MRKIASSPLLLCALLLAGGCDGGSTSSTARTPSAGGGSPSALSADAESAATGDIPDNQVFLTFADSHLHFSMLYPEGWTIHEGRGSVSISDKNNLVRISVARGPAPTVAQVTAQLAQLKRSMPSAKTGHAQAIPLHAGPGVKATYTTQSAPNPVTGKPIQLAVDRYVLGHRGHVAVVDLGTPVGVDNVDAYRRMIESFKWLEEAST